MIKCISACLALILFTPLLFADHDVFPAPQAPGPDSAEIAAWLDKALAAAKEIKDDNPRDEALSEIASAQCSYGRQQAALETLGQIKNADKKVEACYAIANNLGSFQAVMDFVKEVPNDSAKDTILSDIVQQECYWADRGDTDVLEAAARISDPSTRAYAFMDIFQFGQDPDVLPLAVASVLAMPDGEQRDGLLEQLTDRLAWMGRISEAMALAMSIESAESRDAALVDIVGALPKFRAPEDAMAIAQTIETPLAKARALQYVASRCSGEKSVRIFREAVAAAAKIEKPEERKNILMGIMNAQARKGFVDDVRATAYAAGMNNDATCSAIANAYASSGNFAEARRAAMGMSSIGMQVELLRNLAREANYHGDAEAVAAWTEAAQAAAQMDSPASVNYIIGCGQPLAFRSPDAAAKIFALAATVAAKKGSDLGLITVVRVQYNARLFADAVQTACKITNPDSMADALNDIIYYQARCGDENGAHLTAMCVMNVMRHLDGDRDKHFADLAGTLARTGLVEDALAAMQNIKDPDRKAACLPAIARAQAESGDHLAAEKTIEEAINSPVHDGLPRAQMLCDIADEQKDEGFQEEAAETYLLAVDAAKAATEDCTSLLRNIADSQNAIGRSQDARETLLLAAACAQRIQDPDERTNSLESIGYAQMYGNFNDDAMKTFTALVEATTSQTRRPDIEKLLAENGMYAAAMKRVLACEDESERAGALSNVAEGMGACADAAALSEAFDSLKDQPPDVRVKFCAGVATGLWSKTHLDDDCCDE